MESDHDQLIRLKERVKMYREYLDVRLKGYQRKASTTIEGQEVFANLLRFDGFFQNFLDDEKGEEVAEK